MLHRLLLVLGLSAAGLVAAMPSVGRMDTVPRPPDFERYLDMKTLTQKDLHTDKPGRRIIFVGDMHGMVESLHLLLAKVKYNPSMDTIVHTGDIITKGFDSIGTLEWLSFNSVLGVRGNQDQKVIEWRGWIEWVAAQSGGAKWLAKMEGKYPDGVRARDMESRKKDKKFPIDSSWVFNGHHYQLARNMSAMHYNYLLNLPLTLHLAPLHTFVVHAGILPMDPTRKPTAKRQPLSHVPEVDHPKPPTRMLREAQELAIVRDVPQNIEPFARLNMRSILDDGSITREGDIGEPWSNLWNAIISKCTGFASVADDTERSGGQRVLGDNPKFTLPCHPTTIVYGHAASRSLDIKRWTKGLDTGCVYGRRLTALIVDGRAKSVNQTSFEDDDSDDFIEFGEEGSARLASVPCPEAEPA